MPDEKRLPDCLWQFVDTKASEPRQLKLEPEQETKLLKKAEKLHRVANALAKSKRAYPYVNLEALSAIELTFQFTDAGVFADIADLVVATGVYEYRPEQLGLLMRVLELSRDEVLELVKPAMERSLSLRAMIVSLRLRRIAARIK